MCSKKERKVPVLFKLQIKTCVQSSLNISSENPTQNRSRGALWRMVKGLLCKVEFPTGFLVNTDLFPIWLVCSVGWFQMHAVSPSPWQWGHLQTAEQGNSQKLKEAHENSFTSFISHHRITCSTRWYGGNIWNLLPLAPAVMSPCIFVSHSNSQPPSSFIFFPDNLIFHLGIPLWSLLNPALSRCYSIHPGRAMPAHHLHEFRNDWVYLTKLVHKSHLPAADLGCWKSTWGGNTSPCLCKSLGSLPRPRSQGQKVGWLRKGPLSPLGMTIKLGFYPTWDAKSCFQTSDTDEPFELWNQVMLLAF